MAKTQPNGIPHYTTSERDALTGIPTDDYLIYNKTTDTFQNRESSSWVNATAPRTDFESTFDATTSWGAASGGLYTITITAATHGFGQNVSDVILYETVSGDSEQVIPNQVLIDNTTGDVSFNVTETPDGRFAGKVKIQGEISVITQTYNTVQEDGSSLTQRPTLNFGNGLTASDNAGSSRTDVVVDPDLNLASLEVSSGLVVGFDGAPAADIVYVGDASFGINYSSGTNPLVNFDTNDYFDYTRSTDTFGWTIGASQKMFLSSSLLKVDGDTFNVDITNNRVGIGTSSPHCQLHLGNSVSNRKIILYEGADNDHEFYGFGINTNILRYQSPISASHVFYTASSSSTSTELMRIQNNGNVGIGTASPAEALDVVGGGQFSTGLIVGYDGTMVADAIQVGDGNFYLSYNSGNPLIAFDANDYMQFTRASNAFFFAIAGSSQFEVTPTYTAVKSLGAGDVQSDGNGVLSVTSDSRLKKDIQDFNRGLNEIMSLQPRTYKWNEESPNDSDTTYAGFVAQEVMEIIPEAVNEGPDGYYGFTDRPIIAALVNSVKQLKNEIELLKAQ